MDTKFKPQPKNSLRPSRSKQHLVDRSGLEPRWANFSTAAARTGMSAVTLRKFCFLNRDKVVVRRISGSLTLVDLDSLDRTIITLPDPVEGTVRS